MATRKINTDAEFVPPKKDKKPSAKEERSNSSYARGKKQDGQRGDKQSKPHNAKRGKS